MAESVAGFLFEKLSALLTQEVSLLRGVRTEVEEIKLELENMRAFLRDADRRKDSNDRLKTWVGQVRDATYEVEDIIDEFVHRMDKPQRGGFRGFLLNTITPLKNIHYRHSFATQLQDLKRNMAAISMRKDQYNLINTEDGASCSQNANERRKHHGETALYEDDDEVVGLKERIDQIVVWLTGEEPRRTVISVVGMGGLGKTTLVAKAYKHQMVKKHFECCVWVSVSQSYNVEGLLKSVITDLFMTNKHEIPSNMGSMNRLQLVKMVHDYLDTKRYLVVLDDVWRVDAWKNLNIAFPRNKCGSRIMLTTRDENVASALGDGSRPFPLERLQEKEAWELFSKKAFWKECPPELQQLAQKIVEKCGGLPLAIVSLGSLLKDKTALEWDRVDRDLSSKLTNDQMLESVKHILLLSFYDLPYHLKHCFLYCCMFSEGYLIHRRQLIRLWVAEGFVEEKGKLTMEEAAEDHLKELIHRNMLQVVETNEFGRVRACRMHDIIREVAVSLSHEEKFCTIYDELQAKQNGKVRRMSIYSSGEINHSNTGMTHLRSLMVFDGNVSFSSYLNTMASSFRLLRVLNLRGIPIESIPDEVTNMFNLRYLNLSETNVGELPGSLWKLQNLQTLDVRNTKLERLPSGIVKLWKLRHLYIYRITDQFLTDLDCLNSIQVPIRICNLTSLQTLRVIEDKEGEIVRKVGNLTQLRGLSISKVREIDGAELCNSIGKMKHLLKLSVTASAEEETLQLEAISPNPPPLLQKLCLNGRLEKVPRWLSSLVNLAQLSLNWSKLREEDPLSSLPALPNLMFLHLLNAYEGQQLCFRDGKFTKLRKLYLKDMKHLNRIVIENGALASIQELTLFNCGELKTLPEGIEHLRGLQELALLEMPTELTDGSEMDRSKVGHIPIILRGQRTAEGMVMSNWPWNHSTSHLSFIR